MYSHLAREIAPLKRARASLPPGRDRVRTRVCPLLPIDGVGLRCAGIRTLAQRPIGPISCEKRAVRVVADSDPWAIRREVQDDVISRWTRCKDRRPPASGVGRRGNCDEPSSGRQAGGSKDRPGALASSRCHLGCSRLHQNPRTVRTSHLPIDRRRLDASMPYPARRGNIEFKLNLSSSRVNENGSKWRRVRANPSTARPE